MKKAITLILLLISPFCLVAQTAISIKPQHDTYLFKGAGTGDEITQGMEPNLISLYQPAVPQWSNIIYLKFDLNDVAKEVATAKLRLYATIKEAHTFDLFTTSLSNWAEDQLSYNNGSTLTGTASSSPIASLAVTGTNTSVGKYFEWDISVVIKDAAARGDRYISLKLQDNYRVPTSGTAIKINFSSKENIANKPELAITYRDISSFALSSLKLNGTSISGFDPTNTKYVVTLPYGSALSIAVAVAQNSSCVVSYNPATNLFGAESERTTKITSTLGTESVVFRVVFEYGPAPTDARLSGIKVDGVDIENFNKDTYTYTQNLPYTSISAPVITPLTFPYSDVIITSTNPTNILSANANDRKATISVKSKDGTATKIYTIEFIVLPKLDIFLAIGQSNMTGRAAMLAGDDAPIDGVYLLTKGGNAEVAKAPLNRYSSLEFMSVTNQIGPAFSFVKKIKAITGNNVGLVHNSLSATAISLWLKGDSSKYYDEALRRLKQMEKFGVIKGIIWHQGEGDSWRTDGGTYYLSRLKTMITDYRTDLGLPNLYFVVGQIGGWVTSYDNFNVYIVTAPTTNTNLSCVTNEGLTYDSAPSNVHFDRASYLKLGERYADLMLKNVYGITLKIDEPSVNGLNESTLAKVFSKDGILKVEEVNQDVSLSIFDTSGRTIISKPLDALRSYSFKIQSGIYIVKLSTPSKVQTVKVVL